MMMYERSECVLLYLYVWKTRVWFSKYQPNGFFFFAFKGNLGTLGSSSVGKKKSMTSETEE